MTLRLQVFVALAVVSSVLLGAFTIAVVVRLNERAVRLAEQGAEENAALLALIAQRGLVRAVGLGGRAMPDQAEQRFDVALKAVTAIRPLFALGVANEGIRVRLYDGAGTLRFDTAENSEHEEPQDVALGSAWITSGGDRVGQVTVERAVVGVRRTLAGLLPELAAGTALLIVLALLAASGIASALGGPIVRLTAAARRIAAGERHAVLPAPQGHEVRELTDAFEAMRRELEDSHRIERFTQDLSHELKNPIAAVRALSESLSDGGLADAKAGPALVARIAEAAARLEVLLRDVLTLARLDAGGVRRADTIALAPLILRVCDAAGPLAESRSVRMEIETKSADSNRDAAVILGDAAWLERAFTNLIDNAVLHAEPGSAVCVFQQNGRWSIQNRAQIEPAIADTMFERFASHRPGGTGLGLAIARSVLEAHGGGVTLLEPGPPLVIMQAWVGP